MENEKFAALMAAGFDVSWLRSLEKKHGDTVWDLLELLLNQGFTTNFLVEAFTKLHPLMLDIFAHVFQAPAEARMAMQEKMGAAASVGEPAPEMGALIDGIPSNLLNGPIAEFLLAKLIAILPELGLTGWKLSVAQWVMNFILDNFVKPKAAVAQPEKMGSFMGDLILDQVAGIIPGGLAGWKREVAKLVIGFILKK